MKTRKEDISYFQEIKSSFKRFSILPAITSIVLFIIGIVIGVILIITLPKIEYGLILMIGSVAIAIIMFIISDILISPIILSVLYLENINKQLNDMQKLNIENANKKSLDALLEYKKLLDDGIITQEEFDAKKKELL